MVGTNFCMKFPKMILLVKLARDLTRVFTPKWWFSKGNPRKFQGNLGWWNIIIRPDTVVYTNLEDCNLQSIFDFLRKFGSWGLGEVKQILKMLHLARFLFFAEAEVVVPVQGPARWPGRFFDSLVSQREGSATCSGEPWKKGPWLVRVYRGWKTIQLYGDSNKLL